MSKSFTFRTALKAGEYSDGGSNSVATVTITATAEAGKKPAQVIHYHAGLLFSTAYHDCNAVRSYSTGKNRDSAVIDNDYGDLVVADFNFDGRDDFAAKNDSGGNAGPLYNYYVQLASGQFVLDQFLTQEMQFFPDAISKAHRTLTTRVHAGANGLGETVFRLSKAGKWAQISHRLLPVN